MTQYSEFMSKLDEISKQSKKWISEQQLRSLDVLNSFQKNFVCGNVKFNEANAITIEKQPLSNISEVEDEGNKNDKQKKTTQRENSDKGEQNPAAEPLKDLGTNFKMPEKPPTRAAKRRNNSEATKNSPEIERRPKRGASIRAVQVISQQVNLSLTQKLRRPAGNKENIPNSNDLVKVKQEKLSIPLEPEGAVEELLEQVSIKTEPELMPPPPPKNKRANKNTGSGSTRSTRSNASVSASASAAAVDHTSDNSDAEFELPKPEPPRPKRTRAKKKQPEQNPETEEPPKENSVADTQAKPRPKRTKKQPRKYSDSQTEENASATSSPIIKQSRKLRKPNPDTEPKQSDSRNTDASTRADSEGSGRTKKTTQSKDIPNKETQVEKLVNGHKSSNSSTHSDFEEEPAKGKNNNEINKPSTESTERDSRKPMSKRNLQKQLQKEQEEVMQKEKEIQLQNKLLLEQELREKEENELREKEQELRVKEQKELREKQQKELREKEQQEREKEQRELRKEELRKEEERLENEMRGEDIKAKTLRDKQIRDQVKKIEEIRERQKCEQELRDKDLKLEQDTREDLERLLKEQKERESELLEKQLKLQQEIENQTSKAGPKRKKLFKDLEKLQKEKEEIEMARAKILDEKQGIEKAADETFVLESVRLDGTVVLSGGSADLAALTLDKSTRLDATVTLDKRPPSNATVLLSNGCDAMTDDSILTDDSEQQTPPGTPPKQPTSAVKEKVQQFEQLFSGKRITRTKSKLLAKTQDAGKEHVSEESVKPVAKPLAPSLLSATKPRNNIVANGVKTFLASVTKQTARPEEPPPRSKEDPLKKKQEMLEAKQELQRRRREEKMAAAAEARERAQRMRRAQLEAAQREKEEKHANAGQGKLKRLQEAEERRLAQEKKILEIEERRKAEELARQLKFEEEQRRAEAARKRQQAEQEKCKREAAKIEKEMQQAKQQYQEKERQRLAMLKLQADQFHTPMKSRVVSRPAQPEARANGFELLEYRDSDDEEGTPAHIKRRNPEWGQSKNKHRQLAVQSRVDRSLVERLMGARGQTPDLLQLFPAVDRRMLKRTSSAVWHTPPHAHLPTLLE